MCFELDHFVKGKGLAKAITTLVGGKLVYPKGGVTA